MLVFIFIFVRLLGKNLGKTGKSIIGCSPNWLDILDYRYTILITGGFGSGKTNISLNLISH